MASPSAPSPREGGTNYATAMRLARRFAREGPRVAAVLHFRETDKYFAIPGFVDNNRDLPKTAKQVRLVTPDGRAWSLHPRGMKEMKPE